MRALLSRSSSGWLMLALLLPAALIRAPAEELTRAGNLAAFQKIAIVPETDSFFLAPGEFPRLRWEQPLVVREAWGSVLPLTVRWFNAGGEEVIRAERSGRYAAFVEARVPHGPVIRRSYTFYAYDPEWAARMFREQAAAPAIAFPMPSPFTEAAPVVQQTFKEFAEEAVNQAVFRQEKGAILLAAAESTAAFAPEDPRAHPLVQHQEHHLKVRRKVLGVESAYPPLQRPLRRAEPATMLRTGTTTEAGFEARLPDQLRELCERWLREGGEPFTLVVARRGVMVFHEAFGQRDGQPVTRDTAYPLFSITKTLTGLMLAQFLDQKLLDLDAPLGKVLADFPTEGEQAITLRDCLMHVTGIEGQVAFGGIDNPWMDNVIANAWETHRKAYAYSGTACDLAGFAMQMACGKSVPRLFHEHLFVPLEMKNARVTGLGMGGELRALDLARVGQMLLNRGSYGQHTFFGPESYEKLLPRAYAELYPDLQVGDREYGLGIRFAREPHPDAGKEGRSPQATILSPNTLGHGSFSGCIFRVDPDREIVIAMGRFGRGERHGQFAQELFLTIADNIR